MKVLSVLFGAALLVGLAGCPNHGPLTVIDLDQGALHIVGVSGIAPKITRTQAAEDFDRFADQFATGPVVPVLGRVTTKMTFHGTQTEPSLKGTIAWVYITHPDYSRYTGHCPGFVAPPATPSHASNAIVFIVDATTGGAYEYKGPGRQQCGFSQIDPELKAAAMRVSVPWTYRKHVFRVKLPPCGSIGQFGAGYVYAIVHYGPCNKKGTVFVRTQVLLHMGTQIAPVGVVCGPAFDPIIPRPASCLNGIAPGGIVFP